VARNALDKYLGFAQLAAGNQAGGRETALSDSTARFAGACEPFYCEQEVLLLGGFPGHFQRGLVIPVYRESAAVLERCCSFAEQQGACLLILVINQPDSVADHNGDSDSDQHWAKAFLASPQLNQQAPEWQSDNGLLQLHTLANNSGLLLVDRCLHGQPLPIKQGVGLARKIGADLLCALIARQQVASPWIANSDADAQLPANYFAALEQLPQPDKLSAVVFPYQHIFVDNTAQLPTLLYEFSLFYYVAGLRFAGSAYAYHTLGSTLCCHYQHYAMVRGFPKRAAAEDFYLLNKLAKTGKVHSLTEPLIELQARQSDRVPFGTGPAVISLAAQEQPLAMAMYHPASFVYLRCMLALLARLAEREQAIADAVEQLQTEQPAQIDSALLLSIAEQLGLAEAVVHCHRHGGTAAIRLQQLQHWFDGFKSLKFIHQLRDQRLGTVPFVDWLTTAGASEFDPRQELGALLARIEALAKQQTHSK
jgi:hypothetical protein